MAEDISRHSIPVYRQALGRIARLGDLYDASTDSFCGVSIFRQQLPPDSPAISKTDNAQINIVVTTSSKSREKLDGLNITGGLQLSCLAGMCEVGGFAKYLKKKKVSFKSVESTMLYNIKTVTEHLDFTDEVVKSCISEEAMNDPSATHVVIEIEWGGNCAVIVTDQNSECRDKHAVEANMKTQLEKMKSLLQSPGNAGEITHKENANWKRFSFEIFGDILPDGSDEFPFPQTLHDALSLMRKAPKLIANCNGGKGKPVTYVMLPVQYLASRKPFQQRETQMLFLSFFISQKNTKTVRSVDEIRTIKLFHLFDYITELRQKVYDQVEELSVHTNCMTPSELEEALCIKDVLEVQETAAQQELIQLLQNIRSARKWAGCLDAFCYKQRQACEKIYEAVQARIEFIERCEKFGAKHLAPPVDQRIASACDDNDNVYVLFHGDADLETTTRNESVFIELAKEYKNDRKTVCYFTWSQEKGKDVQQNSKVVKIKHFRKKKLVHDDVAKQLHTEDIARRVPEARQALCLVPFKARCPGSYDGECSQEERSWTCFQCNETLQFCPDDSELYCSCGHSIANRFQFRCHSDAHGSEFIQFRDGATQTAIDHHISANSEGSCLVELLTKLMSVSTLTKLACFT